MSLDPLYRPSLFRIAERLRWDAVAASCAADVLHPLAGHTWRPVCCWCVSALEAALGGVDVDAYRVNLYSEHDTGCCSFCDRQGRDVLVARISDVVFRNPPVGDFPWSARLARQASAVPVAATPLVPDAGA